MLAQKIKRSVWCLFAACFLGLCLPLFMASMQVMATGDLPLETNHPRIPAGNPESEQDAGSVRQLPLMLDDAGLLTEEERAELDRYFTELSAKYKCDIAVVTVQETFGYTPEAYADDFFDYMGYGYGRDDDGILLLISIADRDFHMTTHKFGIYAIDQEALEDIFSYIKKALAKNDFYTAFRRFGERSAHYIEAARAGQPIRLAERAARRRRLATAGLGALGLGGYGATVPVNRKRRELRSIFKAQGADPYAITKTRRLNDALDQLVDVRHGVIPIPESSSSGSRASSSGGTHTSSSGRSHGGHGGKF